MLHLAAGVDPARLGKYPYVSSLRGGEHIPAEGLGISPFGIVYLPPIVSAFVGADITSGILAARLEQRPAACSVFIDVGTNGEIVLAHRGKLAATSTAAGPAFEGMNIACGMRAAQGALERFRIEPDGRFSWQTIGGGPAAGICGSGLLDIVGELVRVGAIGANGRFAAGPQVPQAVRDAFRPVSGKPAFFAAEDVYLTQRDVRQVQLAKGAIRAGVSALLEGLGIREDAVEEALIAGSFGSHLRAESLIGIGMLPPEFAGKVRFVGNTSQSGAAAFLLSRGLRAHMDALVLEIDKVELSNTENFEKRFIDCLNFPAP
jgi:uncharacterized 2Fe-2S/4Fe-4S cluster protein (DUF4445 family)